jgi:hypothetical protein
VGWIAESLQQGTQSDCNAQKGQNPKQGEIGDEEKQKEIRDSFVTEEVQNHVQNPGKPEPLLWRRLQKGRKDVPETCPGTTQDRNAG